MHISMSHIIMQCKASDIMQGSVLRYIGCVWCVTGCSHLDNIPAAVNGPDLNSETT